MKKTNKGRRQAQPAARKSLAVIYTGGTMGTEQLADESRRTICNISRFRAVYRSVFDLFCEIEVSYFICDPEDSTERDWRYVTRLCSLIARLNGRFDAIIVIHGTDSMGYAASLTSFGLLAESRGLETPVIFTGSQGAPAAVGNIATPTDAYNNLALAFKTALEADRANIADVLVCFGDRILRGITAAKISETAWNAFDCPGFRAVGSADSRIVGSGRPTIYRELCRSRFEAEGELAHGRRFSTSIVNIICTTNLPASCVMGMLESRCAPEAVVLSAMGEGNVRSKGPDSLIPVIKSARRKGVPVCLASPYAGGAVSPANMHYPPGRRALEAGAIPCGAMTISAIVAKLAFVLSNGFISRRGCRSAVEDVRGWFARDLIGELGGSWPKTQ